ncbi:hypothetical protein ACHAWO_005808 [Cyclotella atomus]|uniref:Uncharacterized protein n=1 Tax=Cyclotella atomus TaxID=382360 RepID=A0ABD3P2F0_9STRA
MGSCRPIASASSCECCVQGAGAVSDSISPLYKNIQGSGMSDKEWWQEVLVFAKQLFVDVASGVGRPNSESSMAVHDLVLLQERRRLLKGPTCGMWVEHPKTVYSCTYVYREREAEAIRSLASKFNTPTLLLSIAMYY